MKMQYSGRSGNTQKSSDDKTVQLQIPHWPLVLMVGVIALVGVVASFV
jgi:hypothetical protein